MKPVMQTRVGGNPECPGNCFAACLASILEIDISEIPDELESIAQVKADGRWTGIKEDDWSRSWAVWWVTVSDWLFDRFGLGMIDIQYKTGTGGLVRDDDIYCILGGKSPRGLPHAVVAKGALIIHDPHPEGGGLVDTPDTVTYFVVANPVSVG